MPSCCLIFTGFLTILVSIIVGMYFNRIMPEGMPDDQFTGLRVLSVGSDVIEFLVSEQQLVGKEYAEQSLIDVMMWSYRTLTMYFAIAVFNT